MIPIYLYEKQHIKLFLSKSFLINKLIYKVISKMPGQIGLNDLFCSSYYKAATGFLFLSSLTHQGQTNKE